MATVGTLVERLVQFGMPVSMASEIIDEAIQLGAARPTARKKKTTETAARGTRLPDNFVCDMEYAMQRGLTAHSAAHQAERFRNFWRAQPGQKGIKLDWPATWRNWVLSAAERLGATPRPPAASPAAVDPKTFTPAQWQSIMSVYAKTHNWNPLYGPEPGMAGSLAPQQSSLL